MGDNGRAKSFTHKPETLKLCLTLVEGKCGTVGQGMFPQVM